MTQLQIKFVAGSPTSREAAESIRPDTSRLRARVLAAIASGGLTDEQGIDATGLSPSTYRPRRIELVEAGKVADSGTVRLTRSGRKAVVWIAKNNQKRCESAGIEPVQAIAISDAKESE